MNYVESNPYTKENFPRQLNFEAGMLKAKWQSRVGDYDDGTGPDGPDISG